MLLGTGRVTYGRAAAVMAIVAAIGWCGLFGCGGPKETAAAPTTSTAADKAAAIRNNPNLSPEEKAIAAEKLTQTEVGNALAGTSSR